MQPGERGSFAPSVGDTLSQEADQPAAEIRALWREGRIEEARLALVHQTQHSVFRFLKAMVRDEDVAQDLAQDTFVRAFQSLRSFRAEARVTTWILAIARNVALNRSRRMRLEQRWHQPTDRPPDVADPRVAPEPGEPRLTAALAALPTVQREAVVLYYVEGFGVDDVARITDRRSIPSRATCAGLEPRCGRSWKSVRIPRPMRMNAEQPDERETGRVRGRYSRGTAQEVAGRGSGAIELQARAPHGCGAAAGVCRRSPETAVARIGSPFDRSGIDSGAGAGNPHATQAHRL